MTKVALCLLLPYFSFASMAAAVPRVSVRINQKVRYSQIDYVPSEQGISELGLPINILAASPRLDFFGGKGEDLGNCSSSVVSDSGAILTAGHCIVECLRSHGLVDSSSGTHIFNRQNLKNVSCKMKLNGIVTTYSVAAISPCAIVSLKHTPQETVDRCGGLDYAVLIPNTKLSKEIPCLLLSQKQPSAGTPIASIGYPQATIRKLLKKSARDTNGQTQELTTGKVIEFKDRCFRDVDISNFSNGVFTRGEVSLGDYETIKKLEKEIKAGRILQTTADILPGMSGSGLVNLETGSIVGIGQFRMENDQTAFCSGGSFYGSTLSVLRDIQQAFPDLDVYETFRCEKRSVLPADDDPPSDTIKSSITDEGVR